MKVALVVPGFSAHEGDWCIPALLDYVRVLAQRAEVHVFTLRWPERGGEYTVFGATVHALNGRRKLGPRVAALWARGVRAITREHRRAPFDVVHAFWLDEPGWVAAWAGRRLGVPVVLSLAGGEVCRLPDIGYGLRLMRGREPLLLAAARAAAAVTAGSRYLCAQAGAFFGQRRLRRDVRFAPLGVDLGRFAPQPAARGQRILNVGSLAPVKDQAMLVRALRRVTAAAPEAELVVAGDGPLRAKLEQLGAGLPVRWLGALPHDTLPDVYRGAAVFAQASRHEAQGMAVLEAAACGVPVVGTPVGVLPELGVPAATEAELAAALVAVLRDPGRRAALRAQALEVVRAEYAVEAAVRRFEAVYAEVATR
jgi:glycosyltransferase involved in cell wall biosynthesis